MDYWDADFPQQSTPPLSVGSSNTVSGSISANDPPSTWSRRSKIPEAKEGTASESAQDESMQTEANEGTVSITPKHSNQRTNLHHLIHTASTPRSPGSPASTPSSVTCKGYSVTNIPLGLDDPENKKKWR